MGRCVSRGCDRLRRSAGESFIEVQLDHVESRASKQSARQACFAAPGKFWRAIWMQAYDAVTTKNGAYVQGGGCTTVGVAGLVQSGGFGSFSKHYGTAAAGLLEADVVTADGKIRTVNACTDPDLFWALKGGGGGTFGVVTKLTLRVRELPEFCGGAIFRVKATSDEAFQKLLLYFVNFYHDRLCNDHWGEQAHIGGDNALEVSMVSHALSTEEARRVWQPFLDWVGRSPGLYTIEPGMILGSMPARHWWDPEWRKQQHQDAFVSDSRPGASPTQRVVEGRCWPGRLDDLCFRVAMAQLKARSSELDSSLKSSHAEETHNRDHR